MKYPIDAQQIRSVDSVIAGITSAKSPEEALENLDKAGIDSYVTDSGDLWIRYWQIVAEGFVSEEHAAIIRSSRQSPEQGAELDWLSKNLQSIRQQYGGQWVAIYNNDVVAVAPDLTNLMTRVAEFNRPLITFIPAEPVFWTVTYAH